MCLSLGGGGRLGLLVSSREDVGAPELGALPRRSSMGEEHLRLVGALEVAELGTAGAAEEAGRVVPRLCHCMAQKNELHRTALFRQQEVHEHLGKNCSILNVDAKVILQS